MAVQVATCRDCGYDIYPGTSDVCMYCFQDREKAATAAREKGLELRAIRQSTPRPEPVFKATYQDVDFMCGAFWVKDDGDDAECYELTDMDSAAGVKGAVLLNHVTIGFYSNSVTECVDRLRSALDSGIGIAQYRAVKDRERRRSIAWEEMARYGYGDSEETVIVYEPKAYGGYRDEWSYDAETVEVKFGRKGVAAFLRGRGLPISDK